jgi:hypothetical protein
VADAKPMSRLKVSLTDAPTFDFSRVHVNIKHVELWLEGKGKEARLIIAEGLGDVDLLTLRNGVLLPLADLSIPANVNVRQIRLVLDSEGHYGVRNSGATCELRTPSAQQSGIKVILNSPVNLSAGYDYSLVIDFDASKSVVSLGNGDCLLKPVLKIPSVVRVPTDDGSGSGSGSGSGENPVDPEPVTDGNDSNEDDDIYGGFDPRDPSTWPPGMTEDEIANYF